MARCEQQRKNLRNADTARVEVATLTGMSRPFSRHARVMLIAALFGLVAAACGGTETTASTSDAIAAQTAQAEGDAPAAEGNLYSGDFVDLNGQTIDLASYEGQDVVLWFWAPW